MTRSTVLPVLTAFLLFGRFSFGQSVEKADSIKLSLEKESNFLVYSSKYIYFIASGLDKKSNVDSACYYLFKAHEIKPENRDVNECISKTCGSYEQQDQQSDSIKYINAVKFIQHDKKVEKYRAKYFFKKSRKFRVSEHIIYNYHPLRYFDKHLDSLGLNQSMVDSLCSLPKDTITTVPFAPKRSVDNNSDYILYFGKPIHNLLFIVIEDDEKERQDTKYYGLCCRPFIILLVFDTNNNVTKAYCSAPIID